MKYFIILFSFIFLSCSTISYNPETNSVTYMRLGNQELNGLKVIKLTDGEIRIYLEGQKATDESLQEILKIVKQLSLTIP